MKLVAWTSILAALVIAPLLLHAIGLSRTPPFDVGLPEGTPLRVRVADLVAEIPCGRGRLQLKARRASAGHEEVLHFRLGPSTFLDLRDVAVEFRDEQDRFLCLRGPRARLMPHALEFREHIVIKSADGSLRGARKVQIHLDSGRVAVD